MQHPEVEPKSDLGLVSVTKSLDVQAVISQAEALKLSRPTVSRVLIFTEWKELQTQKFQTVSLQCGISWKAQDLSSLHLIASSALLLKSKAAQGGPKAKIAQVLTFRIETSFNIAKILIWKFCIRFTQASFISQTYWIKMENKNKKKN